MSNWHLYILRCADGSLYSGITTDLERRLREHNQGTAAKPRAKLRHPNSPQMPMMNELTANKPPSNAGDWKI